MKKGKTISLTASINLKEGSDLAGVLEAMECILEHPDIESTEIEYETGGQMQKVFRSKQGEAPMGDTILPVLAFVIAMAFILDQR